jgi:hypothetical protein
MTPPYRLRFRNPDRNCFRLRNRKQYGGIMKARPAGGPLQLKRGARQIYKAQFGFEFRQYFST